MKWLQYTIPHFPSWNPQFVSELQLSSLLFVVPQSTLRAYNDQLLLTQYLLLAPAWRAIWAGPGLLPNSTLAKTQYKLSPTLLLPARAIRLCMVHCLQSLGGLVLGWEGWVALVGWLVSISKIWYAVTPLSRWSRVCESTFYWTSLWCSWPRGRASSQWDLSFEARLTNSARHVIRTGYKYKYEYIEHKYTLRGTIPQFRPQCDLLGEVKASALGNRPWIDGGFGLQPQWSVLLRFTSLIPDVFFYFDIQPKYTSLHMISRLQPRYTPLHNSIPTQSYWINGPLWSPPPFPIWTLFTLWEPSASLPSL